MIVVAWIVAEVDVIVVIAVAVILKLVSEEEMVILKVIFCSDSIGSDGGGGLNVAVSGSDGGGGLSVAVSGSDGGTVPLNPPDVGMFRRSGGRKDEASRWFIPSVWAAERLRPSRLTRLSLPYSPSFPSPLSLLPHSTL